MVKFCIINNQKTAVGMGEDFNLNGGYWLFYRCSFSRG